MSPKSTGKRLEPPEPSYRTPSKRSRTSATQRDTPRDTVGEGKCSDWPAPQLRIAAARRFIEDCANRGLHTIIIPDKDADGLSSGLIIHRTLTTLGLPEDLIHIHLLRKASSVFSVDEQLRLDAVLTSLGAAPGCPEIRVIVLDQGSREGPPIVPSHINSQAENAERKTIAVRTLLIDHHATDGFPEDTLAVSACKSPPICSSSLLTYMICYPLAPSIPQQCAFPALLGIFGDLGPSVIKFGDVNGEWPASDEMLKLGEVMKSIGKKRISDAVSLLNAPRRTPEYEVGVAWNVLLKAETPSDILSNTDLCTMKQRIREEVERCTHVAPRFSQDGRVALLRIDSQYQIHPLIATRWASTLKGKNLVMVMVSNPSHHPNPSLTSFSCRLPSEKRKLAETEQPDLIALLREYATRTDEGFLERVGGDFARGHKQATGGIIRKEEFELMVSQGMKIGEKAAGAVQKCTIRDFFNLKSA